MYRSARSVGPESNLKCKSKFIRRELILLNEKCLSSGLTIDNLKHLSESPPIKSEPVGAHLRSKRYSFLPVLIVLILSCLLYSRFPSLDGMMKSALGIKCLLPNNYLLWEATRPVTNCSICKGVAGPLILPNVTREQFKPYAYSYRPIIVKGAAKEWPAMDTLTFNFFKDLFERVNGSYESIDEECQFLNFKSNFFNLKEVLSMPQERVLNLEGQSSWYIGWSNCHPEVLAEMRKHYNKPHFLPVEAEHSHVDYVFMGYHQGVFMHLDYVSRLVWQAQLRGHKVWRLNPPPECEDVCEGFSYSVDPGDILLLDTRQWYHDTYIKDNEFSLTVSSEYG